MSIHLHPYHLAFMLLIAFFRVASPCVSAADEFEQGLLERFKRENENSKGKSRKEAEEVLKRCDAVEKTAPEMAFEIAQSARNQLIVDATPWEMKEEAYVLLRERIEKLHGKLRD